MGNYPSNDALLTHIINKNEREALISLHSGSNINSISKSGLSVLRLSLENGMPSLFKYCHIRSAIMLPCLELNQTPLHRAVQLGYYSLTWKLVKDAKLFKEKIDAQDDLGRTALHIAVEIRSSDLVALLIKYNASRSLKNTQGRTPYDLAVESRPDINDEIIEQLTIEDCLIKQNNDALMPGKEVGSTEVSKSPKNEKDSFLEATLEEYKIPVIKSSELKLVELISRGSSCLVFSGKWRGTDVAIKQFTDEYTRSEKEFKKFVKELKVISTVRHPNLVLFMGICLDSTNLCIVTELVRNFTLFYAIHRNKDRKLRLEDRFNISIQIGRGLYYLHLNEPPIIHRDLKPENCLLDKDLNVKIADFGLARPVAALNEEDTTICIGTTRFMAPELFDKNRIEKIGVEVDVWAFGCVLIEVFSGKRPWHHIPSSKINMIFYEIYHRKQIPIPEEIPAEIFAIIKDCCKYAPKRRPTISDILDRLELAKRNFNLS